MKYIPLSVHTYTDHFHQSTLKYVEFLWTCIWPILFIVVIDILVMHVRTYSEPFSIHTHNSRPTLFKLNVLRDSSTNSRSSLTISTMWPKGLINHLIIVFFHSYCVSVCNQSLVRKVKFVRRVATFLVSNFCWIFRSSATLSEKRALRERLGYLLKTKVYRAQVYDAGKDSKGESIYLHEKYIAEENLEGARKGVEKEHCARCSRSLITILRIMVRKGESNCVEVSREIYTIAVKECSDIALVCIFWWLSVLVK